MALALFAAFSTVVMVPVVAITAEAGWPWESSGVVATCVAGVLLAGAGAPKHVTLPLIGLATAASVLTATGSAPPFQHFLLGIFGFLLIVETRRSAPMLFACTGVLYVIESVLFGPPGIGMRALDDTVLGLAIVGAGSVFFDVLANAGARLETARVARLAAEHDADLMNSQVAVTARSRGLLHDDVIGTLTRIADFGELGSQALLVSCKRLVSTLGSSTTFPCMSGQSEGGPRDLATTVEDLALGTHLRVIRKAGPLLMLRPDQDHAVRRALGEALRNAERHSRVDFVQVEWEVSARSARLSVVDNGVGMNGSWSGWGLNGSLRQPMRGVGGDAAISQTPGGGVTVTLDWPLGTQKSSSSLQEAHADTLRALAGHHNVATPIAAYALAGNAWLAQRHSWDDRLVIFELLLATFIVIGSLALVRRVKLRAPTARYLVGISVATATATATGLQLAGTGSLRDYDSWVIGLASVGITMIAFFVPLRWLSVLIGPTLTVVLAFSVSGEYGFGESSGAFLAATLPPALAMLLGASLRSSLVALDHEEARGRQAAVEAHSRRLNQTVGRRLLEPARTALVPWLDDLVEGRRSLSSPEVRAEARAHSVALRDDLHVHGTLDDVLRRRLAAARRGGTSIKLAALHESVEPEAAAPCLRLLDRALDLDPAARVLDLRFPEARRPQGELTVIPAVDDSQLARLVRTVSGCGATTDQRGFATTILFTPPVFSGAEAGPRVL